MNQVNTHAKLEETQEEVVEVLALTSDELGLIAGGECVLNQF